MILSATTREPVAQLSGPQRLDRIYKAVAAVFMPQASSAYAFLALSIASGIEETPLYLLLAILFASLIELGSLLVYVRFLKRDVNVQDRKDRPILFGIAILSYLDSFYMVHCVHYSPVSSDRFQSLLTVSSQFMTGRLMLPGKLN